MSQKPSFAKWISHYSSPLLLVGGLFILAVLTDLSNVTLLVRIVTVLFISLVLVLSLQIFMGNSGILSFAHIGFMGIGAYASVLFSMTPEAKAISIPNLYSFLTPLHFPFWISILLGGAVAAFVAAVISYPLMRLSDAAAVITTFALLVIIHNVLVHWDRLTNGPRTLFGVDNYTTLWTSVVVALMVVVVAFLFKESRIGLRLRASRDDSYAAASIGINMVNMRWAAFTLSAFLAGVGGGLWAHFITSFSPYAFYLTETFVVLAMLVIGGPFSVSGAVVGTVAVTVAREGLRFIENAVNLSQVLPVSIFGFTEVVLAILLILILIYKPNGIMGSRELRWRRKDKSPAANLEASQPYKE